MKITLHRKVTVIRYSVLATVHLFESRPDVAALLKKASEQPNGMPERLIAYLDHAQLWDKHSQLLTPQGQKLLATQKMVSVERGIYSIWYTKEDELLGTRPILLKRIEASTPQNWAQNEHRGKSYDLNVTELKEAYITSSTNNELTSLQRVDVEVCKPADEEAVMQLQWELDQSTSQSLQSTITLKGRLTYSGEKDQNKHNSIAEHQLVFRDVQPKDLNRLYSEIAHGNDQLWDSNQGRARTEIPDQPTLKVLAQFEIDQQLSTPVLTRDSGDFTHAELERYPLMPISAETAQRWRSSWIEQAFKDKYCSLDEIARLQQMWCAHPALSKYDLHPLESGTLITQINRQRAPASFWHISAIHDLTPTHMRPVQHPFTLENGEVFHVADFLKKMTLGNSIDYCIYVDRYFKDDNHEQNLRLIQDELNAKEGLIITSEDAPPNPPSGWSIKKIQQSVNNHDRYWLIRSSDQWLCWKCSTSLDFFTRGPVSHRVKGTPTFTPMTIPVLPRFLQNELQGF